MAKRSLSDEEREELTAYLDGEADAAARARVESRLNSDPAMRAEADSLKKAWELLDHLPRIESSPTFTSKTLDRLTALRPTAATSASTTLYLPAARRRAPLIWAAAIAAGLIAGWFVGGVVIPPKSPSTLNLDDPTLIRDLRVIEHLPQYEAGESIEFLQSLDTPERFGSDAMGP